MRTNRRAIAIINRNYVVIRQQPPLCRTVFSEATGQTPIPGRFFQSSYAKMHMPSAFPILFGIIHVPFDSFISQNEGNAEGCGASFRTDLHARFLRLPAREIGAGCHWSNAQAVLAV